MIGKSQLARYCWDKHMIPVTPRHGQGTNKSLHAQLKGYAAYGKRHEFCKAIETYYQQRLLTQKEAEAIASIVEGGADNRIKEINKVLERKTGYGDLLSSTILFLLGSFYFLA